MPRRYAMDKRQEATTARRRRLLEAAIDVLGEVGAERLTMEAVAERADTATRTVYNHFASRDELIADAFALLLGSYREALELRTPDTGDAMERLALFVELIYGIYALRGPSLTTLLAHRDDPAIDIQVREMRDWRKGELQRILKSAQTDLRIPLPHAVALAFVATNHATWAALVDECRLTPAKAVTVTTDALRAALFAALRPSAHRAAS